LVKNKSRAKNSLEKEYLQERVVFNIFVFKRKFYSIELRITLFSVKGKGKVNAELCRKCGVYEVK